MMLKIATVLFAAGFIHAIGNKAWLLAGYFFFAAGLQVFVILMSK